MPIIVRIYNPKLHPNIDNILKFCKINDYIVVYGQLLIIKNREIEISVTKIIPVFSSRVNSIK